MTSREHSLSASGSDLAPTGHDGAMGSPKRIQLSRAKGWRMPPNTVKVDRSTRFGNPFLCTPHGCELKPCGCCEPFRCCVTKFRTWVLTRADQGSLSLGLDALSGHGRHTKLVDGLPRLRGKNLACWCKPDQPCHADVLLELANMPDGYCGVCGGDCAGANPPVLNCPMAARTEGGSASPQTSQNANGRSS